MQNITRRNLVAGMGAAALATVAPVAAMAAEPEYAGVADVLIIGAGGAGLSCAIEARDLGMTALVLEAMPYTGGSSRLCNGGMSLPGTPLQAELGIEDSPEQFAQDLIAMTGTDNDPEWIKMHAQLAGDGTYEWLTGLGVEFKASGVLHTQGQSVAREHHVTPTSVIDILEAHALELGAEILCDTRARRLIQDENGRVIGCWATDEDGNEIAFKGTRGVVVCTNGYSRNPEMMNKYCFGAGAENIIPFSGLGDMGDGHKMCMAVGADTRHMQGASLLTGQNPDGAPGQSCSLMHGGAILMNQEGERFVDESLGYGNVWDKVATQTGGYCWQVWDEDIAERYAENDSSLYSMAKFRSYDGLLIECQTLEELAEATGMPLDTMTATIEKYNEDCATGVDTKFGRDHQVSEVDDIVPIARAPFYAWKTCNVNYGTTGGILNNLDCQVVNVLGDVIPGLYAAGTIVTYSKFGIVPGTIKSVGASGCGFGGAIVWGRHAARRINELEA